MNAIFPPCRKAGAGIKNEMVFSIQPSAYSIGSLIMKLPTAEQMRALDDTAIHHYGIPGIVLMENAGRATVEAISREFGDPAGKRVAILVGPGNNGGDGLVIARHLHQLQARPHVLLLVALENLKGDAATNLAIVRKLAIPLQQLATDDDLKAANNILQHSWLVVDAIFGTGLKRKVSGLYAEVIKLLRQMSQPVVAVDIPSGLDADRGQPLGACVRATLTVTFAFPKPGLVIQPGREFAGRLQVVDIGIPPEVVRQIPIAAELLTADLVRQWLPRRLPTAHKGTFGHLLVVAGAEGKTGAAILCGQGGSRSGTGLVTLCVPARTNPVFEASLIEAMTLPLPANGRGHLLAADYEEIIGAAMGKQAMVVGPGMGTALETGELVRKLYRNCELPMVVDADALNILAVTRDDIRSAAGPRILTPHPGEMSRLAGLTTVEIQADRLGAASAFAREQGVYLVLKGADTTIAAPDGRIAVNPTGNPGMASGGMGDVLTGIIGGLLAQGLAPWEAACLGTYAHGAAGDRLAARYGFPLGFLASDLAREFPLAVADLARNCQT
jgi:ADP-dependent NAD(P)H-hydrate dehydratase / NAD(P)H-hydrate epimerase